MTPLSNNYLKPAQNARTTVIVCLGLVLRKASLLAVSFLLVGSYASAQKMVTYYGDTVMGHIARMTEYRCDFMDTLKMVYTFDKHSDLQTARFYSLEDNSLLGTWNVRSDKKQIKEAVLYYADSVRRCETVTYTFDRKGRIAERRFVRNHNQECNRLYSRLEGR